MRSRRNAVPKIYSRFGLKQWGAPTSREGNGIRRDGARKGFQVRTGFEATPVNQRCRHFFVSVLAVRLGTQIETGTEDKMKNSNKENMIQAINNGVEQPVTTAQLAAYLQLSSRTIAAYRAQRRIPFWQINARCVRYRLSEVEKALARK